MEISVRDTEIGIAPEDQATIFGEFRQVGSDTTRKQERTGLGLTLTKTLVELQGGQIGVQNRLGEPSRCATVAPWWRGHGNEVLEADSPRGGSEHSAETHSTIGTAGRAREDPRAVGPVEGSGGSSASSHQHWSQRAGELPGFITDAQPPAGCILVARR
jgi:hypothetical protein